jgi:hypothetical protein
MPMIAPKPSGEVAAADHDWDLKRALMACLALGLLGGLITTTAVAMVAYLLLKAQN